MKIRTAERIREKLLDYGDIGGGKRTVFELHSAGIFSILVTMYETFYFQYFDISSSGDYEYKKNISNLVWLQFGSRMGRTLCMISYVTGCYCLGLEDSKETNDLAKLCLDKFCADPANDLSDGVGVDLISDSTESFDSFNGAHVLYVSETDPEKLTELRSVFGKTSTIAFVITYFELHKPGNWVQLFDTEWDCSNLGSFYDSVDSKSTRNVYLYQKKKVSKLFPRDGLTDAKVCIFY